MHPTMLTSLLLLLFRLSQPAEASYHPVSTLDPGHRKLQYPAQATVSMGDTLSVSASSTATQSGIPTLSQSLTQTFTTSGSPSLSLSTTASPTPSRKETQSTTSSVTGSQTSYTTASRTGSGIASPSIASKSVSPTTTGTHSVSATLSGTGKGSGSQTLTPIYSYGGTLSPWRVTVSPLASASSSPSSSSCGSLTSVPTVSVWVFNASLSPTSCGSGTASPSYSTTPSQSASGASPTGAFSGSPTTTALSSGSQGGGSYTSSPSPLTGSPSGSPCPSQSPSTSGSPSTTTTTSPSHAAAATGSPQPSVTQWAFCLSATATASEGGSTPSPLVPTESGRASYSPLYLNHSTHSPLPTATQPSPHPSYTHLPSPSSMLFNSSASSSASASPSPSRSPMNSREGTPTGLANRVTPTTTPGLPGTRSSTSSNTPSSSPNRYTLSPTATSGATLQPLPSASLLSTQTPLLFPTATTSASPSITPTTSQCPTGSPTTSNSPLPSGTPLLVTLSSTPTPLKVTLTATTTSSPSITSAITATVSPTLIVSSTSTASPNKGATYTLTFTDVPTQSTTATPSSPMTPTPSTTSSVKPSRTSTATFGAPTPTSSPYTPATLPFSVFMVGVSGTFIDPSSPSAAALRCAISSLYGAPVASVAIQGVYDYATKVYIVFPVSGAVNTRGDCGGAGVQMMAVRRAQGVGVGSNVGPSPSSTPFPPSSPGVRVDLALFLYPDPTSSVEGYTQLTSLVSGYTSALSTSLASPLIYDSAQGPFAGFLLYLSSSTGISVGVLAGKILLGPGVPALPQPHLAAIATPSIPASVVGGGEGEGGSSSGVNLYYWLIPLLVGLVLITALLLFLYWRCTHLEKTVVHKVGAKKGARPAPLSSSDPSVVQTHSLAYQGQREEVDDEGGEGGYVESGYEQDYTGGEGARDPPPSSYLHFEPTLPQKSAGGVGQLYHSQALYHQALQQQSYFLLQQQQQQQLHLQQQQQQQQWDQRHYINQPRVQSVPQSVPQYDLLERLEVLRGSLLHQGGESTGQRRPNPILGRGGLGVSPLSPPTPQYPLPPSSTFLVNNPLRHSSTSPAPAPAPAPAAPVSTLERAFSRTNKTKLSPNAYKVPSRSPSPSPEKRSYGLVERGRMNKALGRAVEALEGISGGGSGGRGRSRSGGSKKGGSPSPATKPLWR